MMFLCRGARLSAAALEPAFKSPGLFQVQVKASWLRDATLTLTLRNDCTSQRSRALCVSAGTLSHQGRRKRGNRWCASPRFVTTDRGLSDRLAAVALDLSKSQQSGGDVSHALGRTLIRHRGRPAAETVGSVLFTQSRSHATTVQTSRALSTAAATQKRDADAGETSTDDQKRGEQNLQEPSVSSSSSPSSSPKAPGETEPEDSKPNKTQQLKKVFKEYGAVGVSFHIGMSLMSLGMFYLLVSSGIDMTVVLCKLGFSEAVLQSKMAAGTSTFVLAYAVHKLFAPVRISITLVSVPLIVRYFRKTGLFKPPAP